MIPAFERAKTGHASNRAATVIGLPGFYGVLNYMNLLKRFNTNYLLRNHKGADLSKELAMSSHHLLQNNTLTATFINWAFLAE
jgi:hypothetical protein